MTKETPNSTRNSGGSALVFVLVTAIIISLLGGTLDTWYYLDFVDSKGLSRWSVVPMSVIWEYVSTFPGSLLTALSVGPWLLAYLYFTVADKLDSIKSKRRDGNVCS